MPLIADTRKTIITLLKMTEREGIDDLIKFMDESGFFVSPASIHFHANYEGGLAQHSLSVYHKFNQINDTLKMEVSEHAPEIACLLHDLCKVGCYTIDVNGYKAVNPFPPGHGSRSFELAKQFISMTYLESNMIIYHMGPYGTKEYDERKGEYNLAGALAPVWNRFPACKLIYFADELVTLKEKGENGQ